MSKKKSFEELLREEECLLRAQYEEKEKRLEEARRIRDLLRELAEYERNERIR